jgi:PAS domain S-box-containing protein
LFFVLLTAIIVAIALRPIRDRVQGMVDRRFFREKFDSGKMLRRLSRTVASVLDVQQLAGMILDEITTTMHVTRVSMLLKAKESGEYLTIADRGFGELTRLRLLRDNPIADWLTVHDEVLTARDLSVQPQFQGLWTQERADLEAAGITIFIGMMVGGELVGILVLGPKRSEMPFTPNDLRTLQTLANQVAVAVQNAWLYVGAVEERERAQTILEAAFAGIVVVDGWLRIVTMNSSAETITGRQLAALQGRPLAELLGPVLVGEGQPLAAALDAESLLRPTEVSLNGGGRRLDVLLKVTPLRNGFVVNFVDISRLKEVDRLKSEIVANVSHELRGPLASIKGYAELLLDGIDGEDRALRKRFLSVINEETDRLAAFINDMLDLSRLESGHLELALAPAPVDALVAEVAGSLEMQARAAGVTIQMAVPAGLPLVTVDRRLMHSALKNLVSNAIKFSPRGAAVEVAGRADGGTVTLEVVDHGPGIPAEDLPNLFTKFHRGRMAREAGISGTGLGLVLVRQTVEQHHGAVAVDTAPGRGSRFIVTLPATETQEEG